ncbi:DUF4873 domain-containing protein [Mycobacterium hubeiense]|uniref:DUF4873 domain-containing protein n=1 Tax=Mycobacterium hubeiense TaxID=1867256 RepID=UPI001157F3DF|nr:DUF4873 domain-containing protein [Mycobacterium sp. QGD 101]
MTYDVAVIGVPRAEKALRDAGFAIVVADAAEGFDDDTHTWALSTGDDARVVISDQPVTGRDNLTPYLGVAVHGVPNYFMLTGDDALADARLHYIIECLKLMRRRESTRIEVRYSTQRTFHDRGGRERETPAFWRRMEKLARSAFDLSSPVAVENEVYDGPASVRIGDDEHSVRVRLTGYLDPIDGRYHWRGTVFEMLPEDVLKQSQPVQLTIDGTAEGRITERTPWGTYSVAGVGAPPFALDDDVAVPTR